jgi:CRP/FNR family cyclic AMP-dependent transcriptional regulator
MKSASDHLSALTQLGNRQSFQSGSLILEEGEAGGALYLLQSGVVRSYSQSPSGKVLVHNRIQAGEFFGEMALDGGPRSASVQALTDCECVLVPPAQVLNYMREQPDFAYLLLEAIILRARLATEAAKNMALLDVYERLCQVLNNSFDRNADHCSLTQLQIAHQIGASREMVSKLLKDLVLGGYVQTLQRGQIKKLQKIPLRW